jgi:hypothetical protein
VKEGKTVLTVFPKTAFPKRRDPDQLTSSIPLDHHVSS